MRSPADVSPPGRSDRAAEVVCRGILQLSERAQPRAFEHFGDVIVMWDEPASVMRLGEELAAVVSGLIK